MSAYAPFITTAEEFEKERSGLLEAVEQCGVQQAELHRLEWDNRKRGEEVRELQRALSDAQNFLFEERQRLMTLQVGFYGHVVCMACRWWLSGWCLRYILAGATLALPANYARADIQRVSSILTRGTQPMRMIATSIVRVVSYSRNRTSAALCRACAAGGE